ncbi:MAG: lipopolysaccharide biosynthesis protein [Steroidobacteraceae bacterium]
MRRLIAYSALYGTTAVAQKLLGFVVFLWLAKVLPLSEYAQFGLLYALQQALTTLGSAGVVEALIGESKEHPRPKDREHLTATANLAFLFLLLPCAGIALLGWNLNGAHVAFDTLSYHGAVACGLVLAITSFQSQLVRLSENHALSVLLTSAPVCGSLVGAFIACVSRQTLGSFFVGSALGSLIVSALLWVFPRNTWKLAFDRTILRRIAVAALPYFVIAGLGWLSGYGTNYLIGLMLHSADVARYTFALSLSSTLLLVAGALNQVWCPRFYLLARTRTFDELEGQNQRFYKVLGGALGFAGGMVAILLPWLTRLVGGNLRNYANMSVELSLLFSAYVILIPWWHCQNHFVAHNMGRTILRVVVSTSIAGVLCLLLLMWRFGSLGVYIGFLVQMLLRSIAIIFESRKHWPIRLDFSGILAGLGMLAAGFLVSSYEDLSVAAQVIYVMACMLLLYTLVGRDTIFGLFRHSS